MPKKEYTFKNQNTRILRMLRASRTHKQRYYWPDMAMPRFQLEDINWVTVRDGKHWLTVSFNRPVKVDLGSSEPYYARVFTLRLIEFSLPETLILIEFMETQL